MARAALWGATGQFDPSVSKSGDRVAAVAKSALLAALFGSRKQYHETLGFGLARWQLRRACEYFEEHLSEEVSLADVARLLGLSQSHFARSFRASAGMPPYRWFLGARVRRAQQLLLSDGKSLAEIAIDVGFADQSHFTKTFRRLTGAAPNEWRRDRKL